MKTTWCFLMFVSLAACGDDSSPRDDSSVDGDADDTDATDADVIDAPGDDVTDGPDAAAPAPLMVTKTMVGTPDYTVTDPFMVACTVGTLSSQFLEAIECMEALAPQHTYDDATGIFASTAPHAPPYDGELTTGGYKNGDAFTFAEWDAPMGLVLAYQIIPTAAAPMGMTQDGVQPMIPDDIQLLYGADLLRDGMVVDADFEPPPVEASQLDPMHEGYSHQLVFHPENTVFLTDAEARGTYTWTIQVRDGDGEGWDVTAGPFTVE